MAPRVHSGRQTSPLSRVWRPPMRSPDRPPTARREHIQRFWQEISGGSPSEDAGIAAGMTPAVGSRCFCESGGITPFHPRPLSVAISPSVEGEESTLGRTWCRCRPRRDRRSPCCMNNYRLLVLISPDSVHFCVRSRTCPSDDPGWSASSRMYRRLSPIAATQ